MKLIYDRWRVSAITHREKILTDFQKKYRKYKTFIPELKASSLTKQQEILKPFFQDYDSLRPDEGIFNSVDDFLSRPFYYLSIYEKIRTYELFKKEFPYAWLKHYNTWEKREIAYLRMQNSLSGITIVDNLSSIAGFDFFSGIELKNYERMPSDFAYLNIRNALISSEITLTVTQIKSCLMTGRPVSQKKLSLALREAILFSQLEEICRSNMEFSMKETLFSHIRLPELIYIDGVSLMKKYPALKEGELPRILYRDLISEKHQIHVAISQYVPSLDRYKVKLMLLELTDISEDPNIKNLPQIKQDHIAKAVKEKNLKDLLSGQDKMAIEFELAKRMEMARPDYEIFYLKHFNYEGQNQLKQRMEIFRKNIAPEPYFLAMDGFFQKSAEEFHSIIEPYSSHASTAALEKLYLFYINEYGKLDKKECSKAVNALILGKQAQYLPVLENLCRQISSAPIEDYAFFTPPQLFENLNRYFPLYHKTLLVDKLIELFPDFAALLKKDVLCISEMSRRLCFCHTFYNYACKLSKVFGFSFDTAKSLPHGMELPYDSMLEDEAFGYFHNWLLARLKAAKASPSIYAGYSFPICLSELDLSRLFEIIGADTALIDEKPKLPSLYFDGKPVKQASEITGSISNGQHILDIPCFYPDNNGEFQVIFLRIYERTGVLPTDSARKKHTPEAATETGKQLSKEMNQYISEYIKKQGNTALTKQKKIEEQHEKNLENFKNAVARAEKVKEQIEQEQQTLTQRKEELKRLRTLPPPQKPSAGVRMLRRMGMFKKTLKRYQDELTSRREELAQMEKNVMEAKNNLASYKQHLEISRRAEDVLRIYKQNLR